MDWLTEQLLVLAKLLGAFGLALVVGWERQVRHKIAGVRAHILVSVGACAFAQSGLVLFEHTLHAGSTSADATRVLQAVTAGIGFLAAGVIIQHGHRLQGLTTAISLWATASIGLAVGIGAVGVAVFATAITYSVLRLKPFIARLEQTRGGGTNGPEDDLPDDDDDDEGGDDERRRARRRIRASQSVSTSQ